ncbi:MAG: flagellar basal body L-ring protein FlgH [Spartobacteria bacterium]|nr:flagellar basal body L-ring protein FlgH [Spartobacteria bacterium]
MHAERIHSGLIVGLSLIMCLGWGLPARALDAPQWSMATRLYGDHKAREVGDIITVLIVEEATSSKDSAKETDKKFNVSGSVSVSTPQIDGSTRATWTNMTIPSWNLDTSRKFGGSGKMSNEDKLQGTISARVVEVLPNGNMLIEGKRRVVVQKESVQFILTGIVRPLDVTRDNFVKSTAIADAAIQYVSDGSIAKNQQKGIVPTLWDWINPF